MRIMECVSSVTFSTLINGRPIKEFFPGRGIRQGDLISPYLFVLCAKVFSHLIRKAEEHIVIHCNYIPPWLLLSLIYYLQMIVIFSQKLDV